MIVGEPEADSPAAVGFDFERIAEGCFGAFLVWVDCVFNVVDNVVIDAVFDVGAGIGSVGREEPCGVGVVFGHEQFGRRFLLVMKVSHA